MSAAYYLELLLEVMMPLALLVAAGGWWRRYLGDTGVRAVRTYISTITINLFVPALLFAAAASAEITSELLSVPLLLAIGMVITTGLLYFLLHRTRVGNGVSAPGRAGLLLCGVFGNVLFMGYPLLHFLFGNAGARYAAFADMGAATPLLWGVGVWIAVHLSGHRSVKTENALKIWLSLPPVWAFILGSGVSLSGVELKPLINAARFIGQPTVPVMLLMLGLSIPWRRLQPSSAVISVAAVKLVIMPLLVWSFARLWRGGLGEAQISAVIEAGVPTMLMVLSIADRYRLDIEIVALAVAWTTLLFLFTLPMWLWVLF